MLAFPIQFQLQFSIHELQELISLYANCSMRLLARRQGFQAQAQVLDVK